MCSSLIDETLGLAHAASRLLLGTFDLFPAAITF